MSTINTPTTSSNLPFIYQTPSEAFIAGAWGKTGKKHAEKQQNFAGLDNKEAAVAESLLDLINSSTEVEFQSVKPGSNPLANVTMAAVITSPTAINLIKRINNKKKGSANDYCRVVSINNICPKNILLDQIQGFGSRMGLKGLRRKTKKACLDLIADEKENPTPEPEKKKKKIEEAVSKNHVNRKRYCNVLFSDEIRPKLALRGESLTKEQMTEGLKTDELFHKEILLEYNNKDKHNDLAHDIASCNGNHPSKFLPITWQQSKQTMDTFFREYEKSFKAWKLSGNHGGFGEKNTDVGEPKPFKNFINNVNSLLYLHEFVYQFPDVLSKVFGELPAWAFRESIRNPSGDNKPKPFEKKRRGPWSSTSTELAFNRFNSSNEKKNHVIQYGLLTDTVLKIEKTLTEKRALKRQLLNDRAEETKKDKRFIKRGFKRYKEKKERKEPATESSDSDSDIANKVDDVTSSQEEFYEEMIECEKSISHAKERVLFVKGEITKMECNKENKN